MRRPAALKFHMSLFARMARLTRDKAVFWHDHGHLPDDAYGILGGVSYADRRQLAICRHWLWAELGLAILGVLLCVVPVLGVGGLALVLLGIAALLRGSYRAFLYHLPLMAVTEIDRIVYGTHATEARRADLAQHLARIRQNQTLGLANAPPVVPVRSH